MDLNKDYYKILGLDKKATLSDIKKKYKKLALKLHPDRTKGDKKKEEEFKKVSDAYSVIGDSKQKDRYDQTSRYGSSGNTNSGFGGSSYGGSYGGSSRSRSNPFGDFSGFSGGFGSSEWNDLFNSFNTGQKRKSGNDFYGEKNNRYDEFKESLDISVNVIVSLRDVYSGDSIIINYSKKSNCKSCGGDGFDHNSHSDYCDVCDGSGYDRSTIGNITECKYCNGSGRIYLEPCKTCHGEKTQTEQVEFKLGKISNIRSSAKQVIKNYGHQSKYFKDRKGSLKLNITYKDVKGFTVDGSKLSYDLDVHYQDAIDGNKIPFEHLDFKKYNIKLPKKTQDGDIIKMTGKGLLLPNGKRGDLYHKINIIIDYDKQTKKRKLW